MASRKPLLARARAASEAAELWSVLVLVLGGVGAIGGLLLLFTGEPLSGFLLAVGSLVIAGLVSAVLSTASVIAEHVAESARERAPAIRPPS